MKTANNASNRLSANDLERVIEPLANYICAAERPKSAFLAAVNALLREVEATNSAAMTHFRAIATN